MLVLHRRCSAVERESQTFPAAQTQLSLRWHVLAVSPIHSSSKPGARP